MLIFLNNSAGLGSTLYGGQLNKCRLPLITDVKIDECRNRAADYYNFKYDSDALVILFKNISRISESESTSSITSQPEQMQFCQGEKSAVDDHTLHFKVAISWRRIQYLSNRFRSNWFSSTNNSFC